MLIKIVMAIFIILLLVTAAYFWLHRHSLSLATGGHHEMLFSLSACGLLIVALLGLIILLVGKKLWNVVTLILACLLILNLGLQLEHK